MPDKNISQLPIASAINPTDISVLVDNGTDYQYTFTLLLQFLAANLSTGANISFGATLPQNTTGNNGDVFVNTSAGSFAQKVSGTWAIVYTVPAANGADGTLLYGAGLPAAGTGKNSDSYINTLTGVFYSKLSGSWVQVFSMATGPQGPQGAAGTNGTNGANGNTVLFGTTNPSNGANGANGDFYINTTTWYIFGPKAGGVWPSGTSLIGDTGAGVLPGGTAGQILKKIDGTDFNTAWEDFSFANISGEPTDNTNLSVALAGKVNTATGFGLSSNDYTSTEKTKLANLNNYFAGVFASAAALAAAHPTGTDGQYAVVESAGANAVEYVWDTINNIWAAGGTGSVTSVNSQTGAVSLSTDNIGEGSTNKYFTVARVLASVLTGIGFSTATAIVATDTLLTALGKLQAQISALFTVPSGGTAGQVLAKIDSTNGNTQWVAPTSGPAGPAGATGATGPAGTNGNSIDYGTSAPTSGIGNDGDFYVNTTTNYIYGPKAAGTWPAGISVVGPTGATGAAGINGNTINYGTTAPTPGIGNNGDFYINTATNYIYGPKSAGTWPSGVSIVGPAGATGAVGATGATGPAGATGAGGQYKLSSNLIQTSL